MLRYAGTGIYFSAGAAEMAATPPDTRILGTPAEEEETVESEHSSEDSSEDDSQEERRSVSSLRSILDTSAAPAAAVRPESMDWSDNLEGMDNLLSNSPGKSLSDQAGILQPADVRRNSEIRALGHPFEGPVLSGTEKLPDPLQPDKTLNIAHGHPSEGPESDKKEIYVPDVDLSVKQTFKGLAEVSPIEDKAKAYLKRKKDEQITAIRTSLGDKLLTYDAINSANRRKMATSYLQSDAGHLDEGFAKGGDFLSNGDGRAARMCLRVNLLRKLTISCSFDPQRKVCLSCPGAISHPVLGSPVADGRRKKEREVLMLGDQALPPLLPSSSAQNCIRVIRLEFGSIPDLAKILLELLDGRQLCPGSIILLFSASHLANVGLAGYIEDLVAARRALQGALGPDILVSSAPPLLLCGLEREEAIRDVFDLQEWLITACEEEILFRSANDEALCAIMLNGRGGSQLEHRARIRLPARLSSSSTQKIWCTGGNTSLPCASSPTSEAQERTVINALILDIKSKLAIDLDEDPVLSRKVEATAGGGKNFLLVGSSNARRLAEALKSRGIPTGSVLSSSWRATKQSVSEMAEHVRAELAAGTYTAVVFFLLDNNLYFASNEEGGLVPATRDNDGFYHVVGNLVVADAAAQQAVLKLCMPLWKEASGTHMVIVSPLPRYVSAGCCTAPDHIPNRRDPSFYHAMREDLDASVTNIKNFLFTAGLRNGRVMDPQRNSRGMTATEMWGKDPVHPRVEVYEKIAAGVIEVERSCGSGKSKRKAAEESPAVEELHGADRSVRIRKESVGGGGGGPTPSATSFSRGGGQGRGGGGYGPGNRGWSPRRRGGEGWSNRGGRTSYGGSRGYGGGGGGYGRGRDGGSGRGGRGGNFSRGGWQ